MVIDVFGVETELLIHITLLLITIILLVISVGLYKSSKEAKEISINYAINAVKHDWSALSETDSNLEKEYLTLLQEMHDLFVSKNLDYGSDNLQASGLIGIAVRLGDKISRIWQLLGLRGAHTRKVEDETLVDSFRDTANYAIIGTLMAKGVLEGKDIDNLVGKRAIVNLLTDMPPEVIKTLSEWLVENQPGENNVD